MFINSATILSWCLAAALGVLMSWHYAEKHFKHELEQIKLINNAEIERSMRADGWSLHPDLFDADAADQIFDQDA